MSLVLAQRFWTRWVWSIVLTFINIGTLLCVLYAIVSNVPPEGSVAVRIAAAAFFLGIPAVSVLALLHPVLADGIGPKQRLTFSLPMYAILEGLGGVFFWGSYIQPEKHFVVGWICGACIGFFQGLGIVVLSLLETKSEQLVPAARLPEAVKPALVLGVLVSLVYLGIGISSYIEAQPKRLPVEPRDRRGVLTLDDFVPLIREWTPDRSAERFSKVLQPDSSCELKYEYRDPGGRLVVYCIVDNSSDHAQSRFWMMREGLAEAARKFPQVASLSALKVDRLTWGEERSELLLSGEPNARGVMFAAYKNRTFVMLVFAVEGSIGGEGAEERLLSQVLRRIEAYHPLYPAAK